MKHFQFTRYAPEAAGMTMRLCGRGASPAAPAGKVVVMNSTVRIVLVVILVLLLIGMLPTWPYSSGWGYYPSGGLGLILLIIIVLLLAGKL
jgi:hypothetical protein